MLCNAKICEELIFRGVNFIGRYVVRHGRLLFLLAYCIWGLKQQHFPDLLQKATHLVIKKQKSKSCRLLNEIVKTRDKSELLSDFLSSIF